MNLAIPRGSNKELLFYIWKIIDLPNIQLNDLLFRISYDLFLFPPDHGKQFVDNCLKDKLLTKDDNGRLKLSLSLNEELVQWQKKRKKEIIDRIESAKNKIQLTGSVENDYKSSFSIFLKSFTDKGTLNRAVNILDNAFEMKQLDNEKGILESSVEGSNEQEYYIEFNIKNKLLKHNCHDFITRKSKAKQFCKHLVKYFLLLKEKFPATTEILIKDLGENLDQWEFSS